MDVETCVHKNKRAEKVKLNGIQKQKNLNIHKICWKSISDLSVKM